MRKGIGFVCNDFEPVVNFFLHEQYSIPLIRGLESTMAWSCNITSALAIRVTVKRNENHQIQE